MPPKAPFQRFWQLAARDLVIVGAAAAAWTAGAHLTSGSGPLSDALGVLLGLSVAACAFLMHEWGHLIGALATRSAVRAPERLTSVYLFSFDSRGNSRRQFVVMSFTGFVVTGLVVAFVFGVLPGDLLATHVARGVVVVLASLTVFLEFPLVVWSLFRASPPPVEVFASHRDEPRAAA